MVDQLRHLNPFDMGFASAEDYVQARERGRSMAAAVVASNPVKKLEMEARFGVERCRQIWPEAYIQER